jgi:hypothetical protein
MHGPAAAAGDAKQVTASALATTQSKKTLRNGVSQIPPERRIPHMTYLPH